jgi:hypothetical protein
MALSDPIGEFEYTSRGLTVSDPSASGAGSLEVNYEGAATGYGFVASTMTFTVQEPGAKGGTISSNNVAWLDNGDSMSAVGTGVFSESGTNTWRVRAMVIVSDGTVILSEGEVSLAERTYKGKMYAWE